MIILLLALKLILASGMFSIVFYILSDINYDTIVITLFHTIYNLIFIRCC